MGEWGLLVACGAASASVWPRWVRGGVIVGRVPVLLVEFSDSLAIPSICEVGQKSLEESMKEQVVT